MKESSQTKKELLEEISALKNKIRKLEKVESQYKQAKMELHKSDTYFQQFAEDMPALICAFLPDSTLTYVNVEYCKLFSKRPDELVGRKFLDFLPDEAARENVKCQYMSLTPKNPVKTYEHEVIVTDGTSKTHWHRWTDRAFFNDNGEISHFQSIGQDITERKRMESQREAALEALKKSEERYRTVADFTFYWEYWIDTAGNLLYVSPSCERVTGYSPEEFKTNPGLLINIVHPDDCQKVADHQHSKSPHIGELDFRIIDRDGREKYISHKCQPVFNAEGHYTGQRASNRDITKRILTEEELRKSQKQLADAHKLAHIGVWHWTTKTDTVTWSEELYHIAGLDPLLPAPMYAQQSKIYMPESWSLLQKAVEQAMKTGEPYNLELQMMHSDGTIRWVNAFGGIMQDMHGKVTGLQGTVQDITERKQAELMLVELQTLNNAIVDSTNDFIWSVDPERFGLMTFNKRLYDNFLETRDIHIKTGMNPEDLYPNPDFIEEWNNLYRRALREGNYSTEYIGRTKQQILNLHFNLLKRNGNVFGISVFGHDITVRKQAELFLRESEEKYRNLVENINDIFFVLDEEGRFTYISPVIQTAFGYIPEELLAHSFTEIIYPEDLPLVITAFNDVLSNNLKQDEYRIIAKSGNIHWVRSSSRPVYVDGVTAGIRGLATDITEQKLVSIALVESEEKLRSIVENTSDQIFMLDKDCKFLSINKAAAEISGKSPQEMIGMSIFDIFPENTAVQFSKNIKNVFDSGKSILFEEKMSVHGREYYNSSSLNPVRDDSGKVIAVTGIVRDITASKLAEVALLASEERFQSLFNNMSGGVAVYKTIDNGEHFIFVDMNKGGEKLSQVNKANIIGRIVEEVLPGIKEMGLLEVFKQVWQTGKPQQHPVSLYYDNHRAQWFENYVYKLPSGETVAVYDDVTEAKLAEESIRNSEEKFSKAFEKSPVLMTISSIEDGTYLDVNEKFTEISGYKKEEAIGKTSVALGWLKSQDRDLLIQDLKENGYIGRRELTLQAKDKRTIICQYYGELISIGGQQQLLSIAQDITERKCMEVRQQLVREVLERLSSPVDIASTISDILLLIKNATGIEATGIRLREGDDFPYFETKGFPEYFVQMEKELCARDEAGEILRNAQGNPLLECMCGNILCGRTNPQLPFFTAGGSFWSNCTTQLLASTTEDDRQAHTRNRCNGEGYESVALIPLRTGKETTGLLQLNDHRPNQFTLEMIQFYEGLGNSIGIALSRKQAEDSLRVSEENFRRSLDESPLGVRVVTIEGETLYANRAILDIYGYESIEELAATPVAKRYTPASHAEYKIRWEKRKRGDVVPADYTIDIIRKDGEIRHLQVYRKEMLWNGERQDQAIYQDITERKQAEVALQSAHWRLESIIEGTHVGTWEWNIQTGATVFNDVWAQIIGYTLDELEPISIKTWETLSHPDDLKQSDELLERHFAGALPYYNYDCRIKHKDGSWIWVNDRGRVITRTADGKPLMMYGTHTDITDRKRAEESLLESEQKFIAAFNTNPIPAAISTIQNGRFLNVNDAFMKSFSCSSKTEIIGKTSVELGLFANPLDRQSMRKDVEETGKVSNRDLKMVTKDGRILDLLFSAEPVLISNQQCLLTSAVDITARKQVEKALRESEEQLRLIFEKSLDVIYTIGLDYKILSVSPAVEHMLGYKPEEFVGRSVAEITMLAPESLEQALEDISSVFSGNTISASEYVFIAKDGSQRVGEVSGTPLTKDGSTVGLISVARDITFRKKAEEEKQALEERLQRAEKMEALGLLAGGVAHDLNNVLGIVVGYAELLLNDVDEKSPLRNDLVTIMDGGQRAAAIVQDMLTLARRGVAGRKVLNLNKLIGAFKESPEWDKLFSYHHNVKIQTDLEPDLFNISGSSVHLDKTIFNLVSNASESMTKGGTINIRTANQYIDKPVHGYDNIREGDYVVLSVSDTGEGISETDLKRIFEPFYTKKIMGRSGTGLGLSVVWGTVKDHQGYIDVQSEEGKGTTFSLYFQVTREDITAEVSSLSISEYMGKGESILVVDDVKGQRDLAATMLKKLNYKVMSAASGEDALDYLKDHKIDLLVLDMIMDPGMDGLDTYKSVLKINPKQKAIIVSGFSESDRVHDAQAIGAGEYVKKPYVLEKLGMAVKKELAGKKGDSYGKNIDH